jgi:hypothetical protein
MPQARCSLKGGCAPPLSISESYSATRPVAASPSKEALTRAGLGQLLKRAGHNVVVANPRNLPMITKSIRKSDRVDAEMLARLARVDEQLLSPVAHRSAAHYPDIAKLRARDYLCARERDS